MGYIKNVAIGNNTHLIEPILTAIAIYSNSDSENTYSITIDNFELVTGVVITVTFPSTNLNSAPYLIIGSSTNIEIKSDNSTILANTLIANRTYNLMYDGTYWQIIGGIGEDIKVTQTQLSDSIDSNWYKTLLTKNSSNVAQSNVNATTDYANYTNKIAVQPSSGTFRANNIRIDGAINNNYFSNVILSYNSSDDSLDFTFNLNQPG